MNLASICSNLALLSYIGASLLYVTILKPRGSARGPGIPWIDHVAFGLMAAGTLLVTVALAAYFGEAPLLELSGLMLTAMIGWLAVHGHLQFGLRLVGPFVSPLAALILMIQFLFAPIKTGPIPQEAPTFLEMSHIISSLIGQAFGIMACSISILYLWQQNLLKKKRLDQLPRSIPAIDQLSRYLIASLWSGFLFITIGLATGALYFQTMMVIPRSQDYGIKVAWAICVWLWYLATLVARNIFHRPHKRIAQMALGGFALLAIAYFGMGIIRPLGGI